MATSKARVGATLTLHKRIATVFEGDIVEGLHCTLDGEPAVINGCIRVIVADTTANNQIVDSCPPEPYAQEFIKPRMLIIDSSDVFDADMVRVNISDITDIDSINGKVDPESVIDNAILEISDCTVVEDANNVYSIESSTGSISAGGLFESILTIPGYIQMSITDGNITVLHHKGEDIKGFKTSVDELLPKSNDDPPVQLTLTVYYDMSEME